MNVDIFCGSCGATAEVPLAKVAKVARCACGSTDVGLVGVDEQPRVRKQADYFDAKPDNSIRPQTDCETCHGADATHSLHHVNELGSNEIGKVCHNCARQYSGRVATKRAVTALTQRVADSGGTGWTKAMPDPLQGWNDYKGPGPSYNPMSTQRTVADDLICPSCNGEGYRTLDKCICRECGGSGKVTPTTTKTAPVWDAHTQGPGPGGLNFGRQGAVAIGAGAQISGNYGLALGTTAGRPSTVDPHGTAQYQVDHSGGFGPGAYERPAEFNAEDAKTYYPKTQTQSPAVRTRQERDYSAVPDRPYQMDEAYCPECGHGPTELRKDHKDNAWWTCPQCGPLANIDAHPHINPYTEEGYVQREHGFKAKARLRKVEKTGKLLRVLATIRSQNDGLALRESVELARQTLLAYPEGGQR